MRVCIVGVGLMGGSLGMALRKRLEAYVVGVVRKKETGEKAIKTGAIDEWTSSIEDGVKDADYTFFATPVRSIVPLFRKALPFFKEGAFISDLGSTKSSIVKEITSLLRKDLAFVGGHPMTGSEKKGVENATETLYEGAPYILTPLCPFERGRTEELISIVKSIGAVPYILNPEEHDSIVALISHLPYLFSVSLIALLERFPIAEKLVAGNFRDLTRPALSDPDMWKDIIIDNREEVKKRFLEASGFLELLLSERDEDRLKAFLEKVRNKRLSLNF